MRQATLERTTKETQIALSLDLDGSGEGVIDTGIGFFNHMLELLKKHALIDLTVKAAGDLDVDYHHTVEDVGLVFGKALDQALGDRKGIVRYGFAQYDETLRTAINPQKKAYFDSFSALWRGIRRPSEVF